MTLLEILSQFSQWERDENYPPITPMMAVCLLEEMAMVNSKEAREGRYDPLDRAFQVK